LQKHLEGKFFLIIIEFSQFLFVSLCSRGGQQGTSEQNGYQRSERLCVEKPTNGQIAVWYPRLFRTALRMTGNTEDAADLAQQAFYKALGRWDQFGGKSLATTWLHKILVNCVRDWARRQNMCRIDLIDDWTLVSVADRPSSPADELGRQEQLTGLRNTIEKMSETLRPAFVATMLDGYTYQEASEMLEVPVGTIASRVYEARKHLETTMRQRFPEA